MKKCLSFLLLSSVVLFASCSKNTETKEDTAIAVSGVTIDKTSLSLAIDDKATLVATVAPEDADDKSVTWSSSDLKVATVSESGEVVAIGGGDAIITATSVADNSKTATCAVKVSATLSLFINNVKNAPAVSVVNTLKVVKTDKDETPITYATGTWNGSEGTVTFLEDVLPKLESIGESITGLDLSKITISDPNVKISLGIPGVMGYMTDKATSEGAFYMLVGEQMVHVVFIYASDKLDMKGTTTSEDMTLIMDLKLRKGWNVFYLSYPTATNPEAKYMSAAPATYQWNFSPAK